MMGHLTLTVNLRDFTDDPVTAPLTIRSRTPVLVDGDTVHVRDTIETAGTDGTATITLVTAPGLWYTITAPRAAVHAPLAVTFPSDLYDGQTVTLADLITAHPAPPSPLPAVDDWATLVGRVTTVEQNVITLQGLTDALAAGRVRVLTDDPALSTPPDDTDPHRQDVYVDPATGRRFWVVRDAPNQAAVELRDAVWVWAAAPVGAVPAAITAQPTPTGRTIRPILAGGRVWLGYGDWTANTGPIDLYDADPADLAAAPVQRFPSYRTEAIEHVEEGHTGDLWVPNTDSMDAWTAPNDLLTNRGGTWHTIPGPVMLHMLDVADTPLGLFVCGSSSYGSGFAATVYRSTDHGATWTRVFLVPANVPTETARVYGFTVIDGRVFIGSLPSVDAQWQNRSWEWDGTQFVDSPLPIVNTRVREAGRVTVDGRTLIATTVGSAYWLDGTTLVPADNAPAAWPALSWDVDAWITWYGSTVQRLAVTGRDGDTLTTTTTPLHTVTGSIAAVAAWRDTAGVLHTLTTLQGGGWVHHEYAPPAWMRTHAPAFDAGMHQTAPGVYEVTSPAPFPLDSVHGFAPDGTPSPGAAAALAGKADVSALSAHTSATTSVHGIADTAALIVEGDPRLTDPRTPTAHTHPAGDISDSTSIGRGLITAADATAARSVIGAGISNFSGAYDDLTGKPALTTGASNNAFGQLAQYALTTGTYNNTLGYAAQYSLTTGFSNNALGHQAQYSLTTGSSNNALGHQAQYSLTTGSNNTALGHQAQYSLTTGSNNTALGHHAQYVPRGNTTWATTTASRQVSIGARSGQGSATVSNDIVTIGYNAIADGDKAMALGSTSSAAHAGSVALGADVTTTSTGQVAIGARDIEVQYSSKGLVLRSPDGSRWRQTIDNLGTASWTKL